MSVASVAQKQVRASSLNRKAAWLILFLLALSLFAMIAIPVWLIMPFKSQTPRGLEIAYTLKRWSPVVSIVDTLLVLALVVFVWRGARRWWLKAILVLPVIITLASAWFARQNHFEWMFNPLPQPAYVKASEVNFINDDDRVLSVTIGGESVAYPVRLIAYHHLVGDTVGGTPIVATY